MVYPIHHRSLVARTAGGGGPFGGHAMLANDLTSWYKMDEESGVRVDTMGNYDLTDNNTVGYTAGKVSNAADFVSVNSESLTSADVGKEASWSFSYFTKWDLLADGDCPWALNSTTTASGTRFFSIYAWGGVFDLQIEGDHNAAQDLGMSVGNWYHIVATYDGTTGKVYVNTVEKFSKDIAPHAGTTRYLVAGRVANTYYHDGPVDLVGYWNRKLISAEVTDLYNSGDGLDY